MFTPNMSQEQVSEMDRRRGLGDTGLFNNTNLLVAKKPWQNPDGTHKSASEDEEPMSDTQKAVQILKGISMPEGEKLVKRGDEEEEEDEVVNKADSAAAASQARSQRSRSREAGRKERTIASRYMKSGDHEPMNGKLENLDKYAKGGDSNSKISELFADDEDKLKEDTDTKKSFNSRSMHIMRPLGAYDPFGVESAARTIPVNRGSVLETAQLGSSIPTTTYKSCNVHGTIYRSNSACHPCTLYKSSTCKACGTSMTKAAGGTMKCPSGHNQ